MKPEEVVAPSFNLSHDKEVHVGPVLTSAQVKGYLGQAEFPFSSEVINLGSFAQLLCTIVRHCWLGLSFPFWEEQ